eukprot:14138127-Alexandrium_andersonii.AAC.1
MLKLAHAVGGQCVPQPDRSCLSHGATMRAPCGLDLGPLGDVTTWRCGCSSLCEANMRAAAPVGRESESES